MPTYFFALNNDLPDPATSEELPHDEAAHEWAMGVTRDLNRNRRHPETMVRVKAYRQDGSLVVLTVNLTKLPDVGKRSPTLWRLEA